MAGCNDSERDCIVSMQLNCRSCGAAPLERLIDFGSQPVAHRLLTHKGQAEPRFPFDLHLCRSCALVQVSQPIPPDKLYKGFNFNFSSWKSEPHIEDELDWICSGGAPERVCEIGANDGRFLDLLRQRGVRFCLGVEPNPVPAEQARQRGLEIHNGFLDPASARMIAQKHGKFDLVVFRQVFEHVPQLGEFLTAVAALVAPGGRIFVDLPDLDTSLRTGDATPLWEEHVNYFNETSLRRVLARNGFTVREVRRYDFSGGCLAVIADLGGKPAQETSGADASELQEARAYVDKLTRYRSRLAQALTGLRQRGWGVAIYGAGVRAVAASNFLGLGSLIDVAVDDQVERHGLFLPGGGIPVVGLGEVPENAAGTVVLLAVNNENEHKVLPKIRQALPRSLAISICGPADIWAELARLEAAC